MRPLTCVARRAWVALAFVASVIGGSTPALGASIYVSTSPAYPTCSITVVPFTPIDFYVWASAFPPIPPVPEIVAAEFRLEGLDPQHFFTTVEPAAGATIEGDPLVGGCRIEFSGCQPWSGEYCSVQLLRIRAFVYQAVTPGSQVRVQPRGESCDPPFAEVTLFTCDTPVPTAVCAFGQGMCMNDFGFCSWCPMAKTTGDCLLAVDASTWSAVKSLFRAGR